MPPPSHICYLWIGIVVSLVVWTIWKFFIWRDIPERILEQEELMKKEKLQEELKKRQGKSEAVTPLAKNQGSLHSNLKRRQLKSSD